MPRLLLVTMVLAVSPDTIRRWTREGSREANQVMAQAPWRIHVTDGVIARRGHSGKLKSMQVRSGKCRGLRIELKRDEIGLFAEDD